MLICELPEAKSSLSLAVLFEPPSSTTSILSCPRYTSSIPCLMSTANPRAAHGDYGEKGMNWAVSDTRKARPLTFAVMGF